MTSPFDRPTLSLHCRWLQKPFLQEVAHGCVVLWLWWWSRLWS